MLNNVETLLMTNNVETIKQCYVEHLVFNDGEIKWQETESGLCLGECRRVGEVRKIGEIKI
jgi:hypothetical protein